MDVEEVHRIPVQQVGSSETGEREGDENAVNRREERFDRTQAIA